MRIVSFVVAGGLLLACAVQTPLEAPVTCATVKLSKAPGACDLVTDQCSDGSFYTISCQDDGTCSCSVDNSVTGSFLAADDTTTYCSTMTDTSELHALATNCLDNQGLGLNLNP